MHFTAVIMKVLSAPILNSEFRNCMHCGNSVKNSELSGFCCRGCETVYGLLKERKLMRFYALQDSDNSVVKPVSNYNVDEDFSYLDSDAFKERYAFNNQREMRFYLEGVHCAACIWLTEKLPDFVSGVEFLRLNLANSVALVRIASNGSFAAAASELRKLGYFPHPTKQQEFSVKESSENRKHLVQLAIAGAMTGNIMLFAAALYAGADGFFAQTLRWLSFFLYIPVLSYSAQSFFLSAYIAFSKKQVSIDVPIVFGIVVGTIASVTNLLLNSPHIYFDSLSAIIFLLLSTRYLLKRIHQKALNSSEFLHFMMPSRARRKNATTGVFEEVLVDAIKVGDIVQVHPKECFPADGIIRSGESSANIALLTGEALPIDVFPGEKVHAGTYNEAAPLEVEVVSSGADTRLGKILSSMEASFLKKAPIVSYLDQVGQIFIFAVLFLTAVAFFIGFTSSWYEALNRALAVAIVVCPCTFALATPLAISLAISKAAKLGIIVKGADVIERLSQVDTIFFDKTGTLTNGELSVLQWNSFSPEAEAVLISLEKNSRHPIAQAIQKYFSSAKEKVCIAPTLIGFKETSGRGVSAFINNIFYEARRSSIEIRNKQKEEILSVVALYRNEEKIAEVILGDHLRKNSLEVIKKLKQLKMDIRLLSGDSESAVSSVARALEIPECNVIAAASPEVKGQIVKEHKNSFMIGDGANDAIALASAYVSMAVQGGMEVSLRAADSYSSVAGIAPVLQLLALGKKTMNIIRHNLVFAVFYNIVGITAALSGHLNPLFAAILMPLSAFTVISYTVFRLQR